MQKLILLILLALMSTPVTGCSTIYHAAKDGVIR